MQARRGVAIGGPIFPGGDDFASVPDQARIQSTLYYRLQKRRLIDWFVHDSDTSHIRDQCLVMSGTL